MYDRTVTFIIVGVLGVAAAALNAADNDRKEVPRHLKKMVADENGNLVWQPTKNGLNKYKVILPRAGISQAIQYEDTSELFYLSEIPEDALNVNSNSRPWGEFLLTPTLNLLSINWPISKMSYGGLQLDYDDTTKLSPSISGHMIAASTPYSYHDVGFSFGNKVELTATGTFLSMGESSEHFYGISVSNLRASNYSISYGQRWWDTFGEFNTAWLAGNANGDSFASVQLEKDIKNGFWFMRFTSQSGTQPRLDLGIQHNLSGAKFGDWRMIMSSTKNINSVLDGPSLATHRRIKLQDSWRTKVTVEAIRSVEQAQ